MIVVAKHTWAQGVGGTMGWGFANFDRLKIQFLDLGYCDKEKTYDIDWQFWQAKNSNLDFLGYCEKEKTFDIDTSTFF